MRAASLRLQKLHQLHMIPVVHTGKPQELHAAIVQSLEPEATAASADESLDQLIEQAAARSSK